MSAESGKLLLIEDEEAVRIGIKENLELEGYEVLAYDNGNEGLDAYKQENPDLVILDVMMPGIDGLEVCREIRALGKNTPIIMLTAKSSEIDKVVGLELGADDYLTKPFGMRELFARIKAVLRRSAVVPNGAPEPEEEEYPKSLSLGEIEVDFEAYRALRGEDEVVMSAKEFELLRFLSSKPDVPVTRDQLLDEVWGYNSYPTTRTVDNFIARLRQKIEQVPERPRFIITVHGVGYKFVSNQESNPQ